MEKRNHAEIKNKRCYDSFLDFPNTSCDYRQNFTEVAGSRVWCRDQGYVVLL